jgi:hypothetical protein
VEVGLAVAVDGTRIERVAAASVLVTRSFQPPVAVQRVVTSSLAASVDSCAHTIVVREVVAVPIQMCCVDYTIVATVVAEASVQMCWVIALQVDQIHPLTVERHVVDLCIAHRHLYQPLQLVVEPALVFS